MRSNAKQREMKTPIHIVIEYLNNKHALDEYDERQFFNFLDDMIKKEKQFIIDVYEDGLEQEYQFHINGKKQISSLEYYDENFNQKNANK